MDNFVKITTGWVKQYYEPDKDGTFVCTGQEFKAGDMVEYEDDFGNRIEPPEYEYYSYDMAESELVQQQEDLLDAAQEIVSDFDNYGEVLQTGFDGGYGEDTAIKRLSIAIQQIGNPGEADNPCESCRKCGETTCGNDTQSHKCFEPRTGEIK